MPIQNYKFERFYDGGGGIFVWGYINDMVGVTINAGRQAQLNQYNADTATCVFRSPFGPNDVASRVVPGMLVRITNSTSGVEIMKGYVNDLTFEYGIPNKAVPGFPGIFQTPADYVTISVESGFARLGRMNGNSYAMAAGTLTAQLASASTQSGVTVYTDSIGLTTSMPATTVSSNWGDWVSRVLLTINGRMSQSDTVLLRSPFSSYVSSVNFSDTTNNATNQVYSVLNFDSLADNYYTQVTVTPESYGPATVQTGSAPYRTYSVNTLNNSTAQATDYANYLLNTYKTPALRLSSIVCQATSQNTFELDDLCQNGLQVSVAFRGTTYTAIVEGYTISASPEGSTYTFYVSAADLNNYLILNNAVFGKLNENRLGY